MKTEALDQPNHLSRADRPLGWIERTLLAVDSHRVFIEASDPQLREELIVANLARHHDVIAATSSEALLDFMARLPVPRDGGSDIVLVEKEVSGTRARELSDRLQARGWSIPVFTVSARRD